MGIESSHNKEPTHQYPIVAVKLSLRLSHCTDRRTAMPTGSLAEADLVSSEQLKCRLNT